MKNITVTHIANGVEETVEAFTGLAATPGSIKIAQTAPDEDLNPHEAATRLWKASKRTPKGRKGLGIAVITYNRLEALQRCVAAIEKYTTVPYHLVICDDGSTDGTQGWAHDNNIPIVTGRNQGCAWNKNRGLAYLLDNTQCDTLLLLEDDCHPNRKDWAQKWIEATNEWGHINFMWENVRDKIVEGKGTVKEPWVATWTTGQCTGTSRKLMETLGFLDSRFRGFGAEHVEWSYRAAKMLGMANEEATHFLSIDYGLEVEDAGSFMDGRIEELWRNQELMDGIKDEATYRPPFRDDVPYQENDFYREQTRALLRQRPVTGVEGRVSIIVPSRSPELLRRLIASLPEDLSERSDMELVVVWNGPDAAPEHPGLTVRYQAPSFSYEEAINHGAHHATGEILVIVNDDVEVMDNGLWGRLQRAYTLEPRLGVCYGNLPGLWELTLAPEAPELQGCFWAIRKTAFHRMGGLEESLTTYGGDEFVTRIRMRRLGYVGGRLRGWTYIHQRHSTYEAGDIDLQWQELAIRQCGWQTDRQLQDWSNHAEVFGYIERQEQVLPIQ